MLSQDDFSALLVRYVAGQSTPDEQFLVDRWLAQPVQPPHPELTAAELVQIRSAMWRRIAEATQGD